MGSFMSDGRVVELSGRAGCGRSCGYGRPGEPSSIPKKKKIEGYPVEHMYGQYFLPKNRRASCRYDVHSAGHGAEYESTPAGAKAGSICSSASAGRLQLRRGRSADVPASPATMSGSGEPIFITDADR